MTDDFFDSDTMPETVFGYNEVILKLNIDDTIKCDGHYNRFLYRVYCFNELFDWFVMSKELEERAKKFYNKYFKNNDLIYNLRKI